jgi:hypothetical protein
MLLRLLAGLFMVSGVTFGIISTTHANEHHNDPPHQSAPELDPSAVGGGIMLLAGGVLLLNERRCNRQQ